MRICTGRNGIEVGRAIFRGFFLMAWLSLPLCFLPRIVTMRQCGGARRVLHYVCVIDDVDQSPLGHFASHIGRDNVFSPSSPPLSTLVHDRLLGHEFRREIVGAGVGSGGEVGRRQAGSRHSRNGKNIAIMSAEVQRGGGGGGFCGLDRLYSCPPIFSWYGFCGDPLEVGGQCCGIGGHRYCAACWVSTS